MQIANIIFYVNMNFHRITQSVGYCANIGSSPVVIVCLP